mmetsp:Transcript_68200/g.177490  ORF Transcript_68200/g.177490 Transcript_68200/m.177490 type:complete len:117 (-) Transcript_68200:100-450(-)
MDVLRECADVARATWTYDPETTLVVAAFLVGWLVIRGQLLGTVTGAAGRLFERGSGALAMDAQKASQGARGGDQQPSPPEAGSGGLTRRPRLAAELLQPCQAAGALRGTLPAAAAA